MRLHRLALAAVVLAASVHAAPVRTADPADSSLKMVSADAAFYSASLRMGEQLERFVNSQAFAKLKDLPAVRLALAHMREHVGKDDNPLGQAMKALKDPANQQLAELLADMPRREIFVYGGNGWTQMLPVLKQMSTAQYSGPLQAVFAGKPNDANKYQARAILDAANSNADKLSIPEFVLGFKVSAAEPANDQIKRLAVVLKKAAAGTPFEDRIQRVRVGDSEALAVSVDGSMIPIDQAPWDQIEEKEGQYDNLRKRIKSLKLSLTLLVRGDYLLLTVGPDTKVAERFGHGPALSTRPELAPLSKFADKKLISVGYTSKALIAAAATRPEDINAGVDFLRNGLDKLPISEKQRAAIDKDIKRFGDEIAKHLPTPGGTVSFAFMTDRGQESYGYDYGVYPDAPDARSLTIMDHLGGSPLIAVARATNDPTPHYKDVVQLLKTVYGHAEAVAKEFVPEQAFKQVQAGIGMIVPHLKRFNEITGDQLLPALGTGEAAIVIDAKWASKKWFAGFDQHDAALPLPEFAVVRTVDDRAKLVSAFSAYRKLAGDMITQANAFGANLPVEELPKPDSKKVSDGTIYFWPMDLPNEPLDKQIQPSVGLSDHIFAFCLSQKQAERLLKKTPLTIAHEPLKGDKPAMTAVIVNFRGMVQMIRPWVEKFALPQILEHVAEHDVPPGLEKKDIPGQVKTVLDVLGCLRTYTSITYKEGDVTVTHGELVIRDLGQR
jgi:hypothetical protein